MRQFFLTVAGVFAGMMLFAVSIVAAIVVFAASAENTSANRATGVVPANAVLTLDLRTPLPDQSNATAFSNVRPPSMLSLVEALARAERDDRVQGLFVRANEFGMPLSQAQEIHDALLSFRQADKFVIVHAQGFHGTSVSSYLAASAADEIWLQDTANFVATGIGVETAFFGGVFERYGVSAEFEQFHEYKNAVNTYTESGYTDAHREAMTALLDSLFDTAITTSAKSRRDHDMTPESLRALIESGPRTAENALDVGLIDALGQVVEAREAALERAGDDAREMDVFAYARAAGRAFDDGPVIALIAGQGAVLTGAQPVTYFGDSGGFYSDTLAEAILDAAEDDDVQAIVFRIDSPGGSPIASDQIWHAVERAKEAGKPVVVSFATVAASGGYYVAAGADAIVAQPTTITGSIGVYGGKLVLDEAFDRVGFNIEPLSVGGDFTLAYSGVQSFTDDQRQAYHDMLAETYEDFTSRVASGRNLDLDVVLENARGRVWTGADAMEIGLIDEFGGLRTAINVAKDLAGIDADTNITLQRFPSERGPFEFFQTLFGASVEGVRTLQTLQALADMPEVRIAIEARERARPDLTLMAPPIDVQ